MCNVCAMGEKLLLNLSEPEALIYNFICGVEKLL